MDVLDEQIKELVTHIHDHTTTQTAFTRRRKLDAETLIRCILDLEGNSLNIELRNAFPDLETRMTASAFVQARAKLLPSAFEELFHSFNDTAHDHKTIGNLRQYRLLAVDGTTFYLPHKAGSKYEMAKPAGRPRNDGQPNKKQSLCAANLIYDLLDNTYEDCVLQPRQHIDERAAFLKMIERFPKGKPFMIIGDRGYAGTNVFEHLNRTENCYWIIREQIIGSATPTEVLSLPDTECDRDVEIHCTTAKIVIAGGNVTIDADGDDLDSNGSIEIKGGTTIVNGPTNDGNGAIDYAGKSSVTGGTFIALESSGMAQGFGQAATQGWALLDTSGNEGDEIAIRDQNGKTLASTTATKAYACVLISTSEMTENGTYTLTHGGKTTELTLEGLSYSNVKPNMPTGMPQDQAPDESQAQA